VALNVISFASLATAGMSFNLLIGAAPNAIAYQSKQFTAGEFFHLRMHSHRGPHDLAGALLLLHLAAHGHAGPAQVNRALKGGEGASTGLPLDNKEFFNLKSK